MELFLKIAAGTLLALVLILTVGKEEKGIALLLGIAVCCMITVCALTVLRPIFDFFFRLESIGSFQEVRLDILMKIAGIGLVSEFVSSICLDAGYGSLGKQIQLLASIIILRISLPILETLMTLIENLLGDL